MLTLEQTLHLNMELSNEIVEKKSNQENEDVKLW